MSEASNESSVGDGDECAAAESPEVATIALEINIAGEKVQFQVTVPTGPATWEDLLPFMRALVKVGSDISQEYHASQGQAVSCKAGCGICCRQRVPLAEFEAHRLRQYVEAMPEPRRSTVLARFRNADEKVRAAGIEVSYDSEEPISIEELTRRAGNYFRLMIPCPFLEDESCSIYEERPLKCREYLVTSPAEFCADPATPNVVGLPQPLKVYLSTLLLDEATRGPGVRWVPLNQLISWTDSHTPPLPSRTGPELLHEFMSVLAQPVLAQPKV